ncbi:hypothetical protein [Actinocrispum wychmicini]|uniref:Uncharacterized protein n=1 Tax=Actinocrispum wychmicini TaxID=1213861 RepID=A0A4V2S8W5_9PSEU|nr:hypothetical protein [Actinocrispum wychmicini]TCO65440.1 hypothetical protein EV192_1011232 [Actinocrispum wychmicini]
MTNPTTREGEEFDAIVGLAKPEPDPEPEPDERVDTRPTGTYPFDLPKPKNEHGKPKPEHGKAPHRVDGTYPFDVPNPSAQAKDESAQEKGDDVRPANEVTD